jgi:hypothetical protein
VLEPNKRNITMTPPHAAQASGRHYRDEIQQHVLGNSKKRDVVLNHIKNNCYAYMNLVMVLCYLPEEPPVFFRGMDAFTRYRLTRQYVLQKLRARRQRTRAAACIDTQEQQAARLHGDFAELLRGDEANYDAAGTERILDLYSAYEQQQQQPQQDGSDEDEDEMDAQLERMLMQ